ncbi:hypothetical protein B0T11DRAFT_64945 [Plectosphaerella cucumerina]|uniref:Uncharacterized protein n=1 Tax=Plectosphaerella cucumerina TaxID=40658 RepID=A0A8K0X651_9PEZI|nr:hypothetical protein B0T11DRAFT_64945 [Plectosphaerella cucumerina]
MAVPSQMGNEPTRWAGQSGWHKQMAVCPSSSPLIPSHPIPSHPIVPSRHHQRPPFSVLARPGFFVQGSAGISVTLSQAPSPSLSLCISCRFSLSLTALFCNPLKSVRRVGEERWCVPVVWLRHRRPGRGGWPETSTTTSAPPLLPIPAFSLFSKDAPPKPQPLCRVRKVDDHISHTPLSHPGLCSPSLFLKSDSKPVPSSLFPPFFDRRWAALPETLLFFLLAPVKPPALLRLGPAARMAIRVWKRVSS